MKNHCIRLFLLGIAVSSSLFANGDEAKFSIPKAVVELPGFIVRSRSDLNLPHFVSNPDGAPLTYRIRTPLPFAHLHGGLRLRLMPLPGDEGDHTIEVEVSSASQFEMVKFHFPVKGEAFKWKAGDKWLPTAVVGKPFGFLLDAFTEGEFLRIHLSKGPRWLDVVTLPGRKPGTFGHALRGTPSTDESGPFSITLELESQDGSRTNETVYGNVVHAFPDDAKIRIPGAQVRTPYSVDLKNKVAVPVCSAFEWEFTGLPAWLRVKGLAARTIRGLGLPPVLEGTPQVWDAGTSHFQFALNCAGNKDRSKTEIEITVRR